jgi:hypothetical protein
MSTGKTSIGRTPPHVILGVHITDRASHAPGVQAVLTEFGEIIKTRIGLHDVHDGYCSPNGLLLLEIVGDPVRCDALIMRLGTIEGVQLKEMTFDHP